MSKAHYKAAVSLVQQLVDSGHTAYFAGGWVRDYLMEIPSDDIDIATTASAEQVQELFDKTIPVGINFGVVIVVIDGHQFEVATFRSDRAYVDGRRPIGIDPATPQEDALRRDFTINGMFYDPLKEQLFDFVGGQKDLDERLVRAIGNPLERFNEDRLRMIRAVRYSARFHFTIDPATLDAIVTASPHLLDAVAVERIWQEFEKMSRYPHFDAALITLHRLGLLSLIFPSLAKIDNIAPRVQAIPHHPPTAPAMAGLLTLFPNSTLPDKMALCDQFKVSNKVRDFTTLYHTLEKLNVKPLYIASQLDDYEWSLLAKHPDFDTICQCLQTPKEYEKTRERYDHLQPHITRLIEKNPVLRAAHLEKAGISPGPTMGHLLTLAETLSINENILDPDILLSRVLDKDQKNS